MNLNKELDINTTKELNINTPKYIDKIIYIQKLNCSGWCGPTIIFLILSFISLISSLISKPKYKELKKYIIEFKFTVFVFHILFIIPVRIIFNF